MITRTKPKIVQDNKSCSYRIRIAIGFALKELVKEFDLLNVLTRVCMEFSIVRAIGSQL